MATKKSKVDRVQRASVYVASGAAGAGAATAFDTNMSASDKRGIEILKIQYDIESSEIFDASGESVTLALTQVGANIPALGGDDPDTLNPPGALDHASFFAAGIPVSGVWSKMHDFSNCPLLAHPASLYGTIDGESLGGVVNGYITIYFRYVDLADDDYNDILQSYIVQNVL